MPTVTENVRKWGDEYNWKHAGDEWSAAWGGPAMQWYGAILPRIRRFLPSSVIVEVASGFGRWTQFLHGQCEKLIAVDISEKCIVACKQRFSGVSHIEYHVTDGKSLAVAAHGSVDFVFSFDSLVHADATVIDAYLRELSRVLKPEGAAFLHHSNLGAYPRRCAITKQSRVIKRVMGTLGVWDRDHHWRDPGVSAYLVQRLATGYGLECMVQEIVHWGTRRAKIDCFSTIVRKTSRYAGAPAVYVNDSFMAEAVLLSKLARVYSVDK